MVNGRLESLVNTLAIEQISLGGFIIPVLFWRREFNIFLIAYSSMLIDDFVRIYRDL